MKKLMRNPYVWGAVIGIIFVTAIRPFLRYEPDPPPVVGYLPEYTLMNAQGHPFGSKDLKGSVYIAGFISPDTGDDTCTPILEAMQKLHSRYARSHIDVKLVSISATPTSFVIPAPDRSRELDNGGNGNENYEWVFLTGSNPEINHILNSGFKLHFAKLTSQQNQLNNTTLEETVAIVDQTGGLRGFYTLDEKGLDEVFHRSQHVLSDLSKN